ncbi:hypothetical protein CLV58_13510 [Spirosoma oryzae]|uniref:Uncharacterized protein n=1 Tax=Spirosoma oryzae TaxID=1469603 RepID=A0A2T0S0Q0_9BACT|nr:hypothetical protein [Spirosoma oryzae]PRY27008.1 hypothetical protein CLV58_13510 [Spirosoma oryzae]
MHANLRDQCLSVLTNLVLDKQSLHQTRIHLFNPFNAIFLSTYPGKADFLTSMLICGTEIWFTTQAGYLLSQGMVALETLLALCRRLSTDQRIRSSTITYSGALFVISPDRKCTFVCTSRYQLQELYSELTRSFTQLLAVRIHKPLRTREPYAMPGFLTIQLETPLGDDEIIP